MLLTPDLLKKHDKPGPRYTSYPTVPAWNHDFDAHDYVTALKTASTSSNAPIALYVHIPFCEERCWYCGCNVVISKKPDIVIEFLEHIALELAMAAKELGNSRTVSQLHWGGGTPTYLTPEQMEQLFASIAQYFTLLPTAEVAIEVDPRVTTEAHMNTLHRLGFNRISMGVQDLSADVQEAIGRNQSLEQTQQMMDWSRAAGFESINIDLIHGLPKQTVEGWSGTIRSAIELSPERFAIYSYAHLPKSLKHQAKIASEALPDQDTKYQLIAIARKLLMEAGYVPIGMDHFAKPDDELAIAMKEGRLYRNFMGYTTVVAEEMVGIGPSAIGRIGGVFNQNEKRLFKYYRSLDEGQFATLCGVDLSADDEIRSWVIQQLMCNFTLNYDVFETRFSECFTEYFDEELAVLRNFAEDDFVEVRDDAIHVLPVGQVFVRNIAMVFDAYLKKTQEHVQFSRTV